MVVTASKGSGLPDWRAAAAIRAATVTISCWLARRTLTFCE